MLILCGESLRKNLACVAGVLRGGEAKVRKIKEKRRGNEGRERLL